MHLKSALFGLNFDAFEYSWDETGGATRIGLALLLKDPVVSVGTKQTREAEDHVLKLLRKRYSSFVLKL